MTDNKNETISAFEFIDSLPVNDLLADIPSWFESFLNDPVKLSQLEAKCVSRATELRQKTKVEKLFRELNKAENQRKKKRAIGLLAQKYGGEYLPLECDERTGKPKNTIENYHLIMDLDGTLPQISFNSLTSKAAKQVPDGNGGYTYEDMESHENSRIMEAIQTKYGIFNEKMYDHAMRIICADNQFNPVQDIINSLVWDGEERCKKAFHVCLGVDEDEYNEAVSEITFHAAVKRIYFPGCKVDEVPVLIGGQGYGKGQFIKYLALNDKFHTEIAHVDGGPVAIAKILGKWIIEIAEMDAATFRNQDAVKAFVTVQNDRYRFPYDKYEEDHPRTCIFIGTTNHAHFLVDKTGNRRWLPIHVQNRGWDIYEKENLYRDYISQCYAEAKYRLDHGELITKLPRHLEPEARKRQNEAMQEDPKESPIYSYISRIPLDSLVCAQKVWEEALDLPRDDFKKQAAKREIADIIQILYNVPCLEKVKADRTSVTGYGQQRIVFRKVRAYTG